MAAEKNAPELLVRFRTENRIALRVAAKALGVSHVVYRQYENGELTPHPVMREAISRWTHGFVPDYAWPVSDREQRVVDAAARVVPYTPDAPKAADESGAHASVDADKSA